MSEAEVAMSTVANVRSRTVVVVRRTLAWFGIALLVFLALVGPRAVPLAQVALWYVVGGPPLDFDRPHNGQVVAHIDVLGRWPPDIARIRISELATGATVWDVKPTTAQSECWNACWNLTFKVGSNPASFAAGRQQFNPSVPLSRSFSLVSGTVYLFEAWDSKGRVQHDRFTL
jgi:hypothetical protein